jgi:hypothetical protein
MGALNLKNPLLDLTNTEGNCQPFYITNNNCIGNGASLYLSFEHIPECKPKNKKTNVFWLKNFAIRKIKRYINPNYN